MKTCKDKMDNAELDYVCDFNKEELSMAQLEAQLPLLKASSNSEGISCSITIHDVVCILGGLSPTERVVFSSVWTTMKLLFVMPVTNASSQHSLSALRRIKVCLCTTQQYLHNHTLLHVHKENPIH